MDRDAPSAFRFELRLWGIRVLRIPDPRSRRSRWLVRRLFQGLEKWFSKSEPKQPEPENLPRKRSKPLRPAFVIWVVRRLLNLVNRSTRHLEIECGGIDPALLGSLTGVVAIVQGALGTEKIGWVPDFYPGSFRFQLRWDLSLSVWKTVSWLGETFADRKRPTRKRSGLVVSFL